MLDYTDPNKWKEVKTIDWRWHELEAVFNCGNCGELVRLDLLEDTRACEGCRRVYRVESKVSVLVKSKNE